MNDTKLLTPMQLTNTCNPDFAVELRLYKIKLQDCNYHRLP